MDWITNNLDQIFNIITAVVAAAAAIAAAVPQGEQASGVIANIRKVIDVLALNVGNAKNQSN